MPDSTAREHLQKLLDYVQHVVRLPEQGATSLKSYKKFLYLEEDLRGLTGLSCGVSEETGAWLTVDRLQPVEPPPPSDRLAPWVTLNRNPSREPQIHEEHIARMSLEEAQALVKAGTIEKDDVRTTGKKKETAEVHFLLSKNPNIRRSFRNYASGTWTKWADSERARRRTIQIYDKFFKLHQSLQSGGVDNPVEVVWGVGMAIWRTPNGLIRHPLIEALVELDIDPETHAIHVRPRETEVRMFLKPFAHLDSPGIAQLQDEAREHFEQLAKQSTDENTAEFTPFDVKNFETLLRSAATLLGSTARYNPDVTKTPSDRTLPPASDALMITDTWAIYARPRSESLMIEDLIKLREAVGATPQDKIPSAALRFVMPPSAEMTYAPRKIRLLGRTADVSPDAPKYEGVQDVLESDLFFPKEYNAAQVRIIEQLESADGVVVQGPPGTGKTHTIANIICHYLATGRRVLVTSQGEPALRVLRDFIPEAIRHLTISLLTKDREGLQQLETAATLLANEVSRIDPAAIEDDIIASEKRVQELRDDLAANEEEVRRWAQLQLEPPFRERLGNDVTAADLAQQVASDRERHEWLPDAIEPDPSCDPVFDSNDLNTLREMRQQLGDRLVGQYSNTGPLPADDELPDWEHLEALHVSLLESHSPGDTTALLSRLEETAAWLAAVSTQPGLRKLYEGWLETGVTATAGSAALEALLPEFRSLVERERAFTREPVSIPELGSDREEVEDAIDRAVRGERPFARLDVGKSVPRALFEKITIAGERPTISGQWERVQNYLRLRADRSIARTRFNALDIGFPQLGEDPVAALPKFLADIERARDAAGPIAEALREELASSNLDVDVEDLLRNPETVARTAEQLRENASEGHIEGLRREVLQHADTLKDHDVGPVVALREVIEEIADSASTGTTITAFALRFHAALDELAHARALEDQRSVIRTLADKIEGCGAPLWAQALRSEPVGDDGDPWTPEHAFESWTWRRLYTYLQTMDGRERLKELAPRRLELEQKVKDELAELVRLRTFLGLFVNMTDRAKSALIKFTTAIRHIGPGDGRIRARRYRRDAREAMKDCYGAVPCWIMPVWRVSETLPPELGSFDLVIVDEASQSDITALPALLRGQKVLIVGDNKQVSPTAPFVEEAKLLHLREQHLREQHFVDLLMPGSSLYDLASAAYPGKRVMLDEHFRCVEPIVRFSFQFYPEKIVPVRIPKASERLDPPLIDVHVTHGTRDHRKVNHAEAVAIADEVEILVNDPAFDGRSIGVVSLIGSNQAKYIQNLLLLRVGQDAVLAHRIECGDSSSFQGRERDIMFISMVASPGKSAAQTSVIYEQRFNVALSRARDRMYLFRSVDLEKLNPQDLKAKTIAHFASPGDRDRREVQNLIEHCGTGFEREIFNYLTDRGYRVRPRVSVGEFTIDLVVEGANDRRLAIILDGDEERTLSSWLEQWNKQKVLERVGWRFWRLWHSSFIMNPSGCMKDLDDTLTEMEIDPLGGNELLPPISEHRVLTADEGEEDLDDIPIVALEDFDGDEHHVAQLGDRIMVNFNDDPVRYRTILLSETVHEPEQGIYDIHDSIGATLLGSSVDDELEIIDQGQLRRVTITQIEVVETT